MRKLATPIPSEDGDITEEVAKVTWRPTSKAGWILPGQFEEFGLSMRIPNKPNSVLTFPARQTYSNGEVVNWNGPASAEAPAPTLTVTPPPTATAAHTPLKSVSPKRNATRKSVSDVRATFKAKMQTGIIELTKGGADRAAEVERAAELEQGRDPRGAEVQADGRQLQGQLARPRRRRPLREGHLELQDQRVSLPG